MVSLNLVVILNLNQILIVIVEFEKVVRKSYDVELLLNMYFFGGW